MLSQGDKLISTALLACAFFLCLPPGVSSANTTASTIGAEKTDRQLTVSESRADGPRRLAGSFFQPSLVSDWKQDDFAAEYRVMMEVGMNHIIWQWTVDSKEKRACYPTVLPGLSQIASLDLVEISLQEAKKAGMLVWLGLNCNDDWFTHYANNEKWLANEASLGQQIMQELWRQYGGSYGDVIAGFYLPLEVDNVHFRDEDKRKRLARAYRLLADEAHDKAAKPVMIAPFFNEHLGQDPRQYADMWGNILKAAPVDVIALQDGVGCDHASTATIGQWLAALQGKIKEVRPQTQLWSDVETFTPELEAAPIERVIGQMKAESKYVQAFTSFSFNHYDSPNNGRKEQFRQYREYVGSLSAVSTMIAAD